MIRGAFVQTRPIFGEVEKNIENAVKIASQVNSDIYVFPELCNTGYAFRSRKECFSLAESLDHGRSVEKFQEFTEKKKCTIVAGLAEKDRGRAYNSSVVIERGRILGTYRKMHLFYREKLWFSKSYSGFKTFYLDSIDCRIGVLICFDWMFPEASRKLAMNGAEVLCHPSDLVLPGKGQTGMLVRAFENHVFAITANRIGYENRGPKEKFRFTGYSQIVSPKMKKLVTAERNGVVAKATRLDLELARKKFATSANNIIEDMRADFY